MPTYMDVHEGFVGATEEQFEEAHRADLEIQAEEGVSYDHAWLDPAAGRPSASSTGPSREAVMRIHERAGHPTDQVYELPVEVT